MKNKIVSILPNIGYPLVIVAVYLVASLFVPNLFTSTSILNILMQASVIVVAVMGVAQVAITGATDLSCGGMISFTGVVNAFLIVHFKLPFIISCPITLLVGALFGYTAGVTIAKIKVPPFIGTLIVGNLAAGLALVICQGVAINGLPEIMRWIGKGKILGIPVAVLLMVFFVTVGTILLNRTSFGNYIYSIGNNARVVENEGINTEKITICVYAISGFCSACAGIILSSWLLAAHPTQGAQYQLDVVASCVIGGISMSGGEGKIANAAMGAIIISALRTTLNLLMVNTYVQNLLVGSILIIIVAVTTYVRRKSAKQSALF